MMDGTFFNPAVIVAVIAHISVCLLYGFDKLRAVRKGWRVPENTLLFSALFAPFGALFGMIVFRHKIRTIKFIIIVPFFAVLQGIFIFLALP